MEYILYICRIKHIKEVLSDISARYPNATHYCYAAVYGGNSRIERFSDNGEPSGTAGRPIMSVLRGSGMSDAICVVVRYFGGTLLGTGGLVVAYREATADALAHAEIVERDVTLHRTLRFPYERMNEVMRTLKDIDARILRQDWQDGLCIIECEIKKKHEGRI